uniref:DUF4604 domain-containing protein n=1 Tax=Caenorhabditis tropicalis TaxID=1561998 RepID=A0A1I7UFX2_9PELO
MEKMDKAEGKVPSEPSKKTGDENKQIPVVTVTNAMRSVRLSSPVVFGPLEDIEEDYEGYYVESVENDPPPSPVEACSHRSLSLEGDRRTAASDSGK